VQNSAERHWRKSTKSLTDDCIEVALGLPDVWVRDSKDPSGPVLTFVAPSWTAFISDIREGWNPGRAL
jgi:hypothetical protein